MSERVNEFRRDIEYMHNTNVLRARKPGRGEQRW